MFEYIDKQLEENKSEKLADFSGKLSPSNNRKILGIKIPILRKMAKIILKDNWQEFLRSYPEDYMEEVLLKGLVIAYSKIDIDEKLRLIKQFIPKIDSWIISDTFCPTIKPKEKDLEKVWNFTVEYITSEKEFEVRFAVIMMLDYFVTDEYVDKVIEQITLIKNKEYYANMAVAWLVAEIGIKYNKKAMDFLQTNKLEKFVHNKALQKMIESYRVSDEQKELLRRMKVK